MDQKYEHSTQVDFQGMLEELKHAAQAPPCGQDGRRWLLNGEVGVNARHLQCLLYEFDRLQRLPGAGAGPAAPAGGPVKSPFVDRDGTEVYEGDRLRRQNGGTFLVVYDRRRSPEEARWRARFHTTHRVTPLLSLHIQGAVVTRVGDQRGVSES